MKNISSSFRLVSTGSLLAFALRSAPVVACSAASLPPPDAPPPATSSAPDLPSSPEPLEDPAPGDRILGEWWTEKKDGRVKIVRGKDGTYLGILTWSSDATGPDGKPKKDEKNPDPKQRDRPIVGIVLLWGLTYSDGEYTKGHVYDPDSGKTYHLKAKLDGPNKLEIRGYVGVSLFGGSETWSRMP